MKTITMGRLLAWALVIAMPLWLGSCKKGGENVVTPSTSLVQGSWKISGYKIDPGVDFRGDGQLSNDLLAYLRGLPNGLGNDLVDCLTGTVTTFNADGKITGTPGAKCTASSTMNPIVANSTWKVEGNKLTVTSPDEVATYDIVQSGNTLKLSGKQREDYDGDGKEETYTVTLEMTKA